MTGFKASCMKCNRWLTCKDPLKGPTHKCVDFKRMKEVGRADEFSLMNLFPGQTDEEDHDLEPEPTEDAFPGSSSQRMQKSTRSSSGRESPSRDQPNPNQQRDQSPEQLNPRKKSSILGADGRPLPDFESEDAGGNFIFKAMRDAYDPETNTVRDLKLDDRELPRANNYWDFSTRISGKSLKPPFARQLWIAAHLFGEICPRCTKPKWFDSIENIPVDMDPQDLSKRLVLLHAGVCPKCKSTKAEMVLSGEIRDINQLVMCVGQRGGKSAFNSTLAANLLHRLLKAPRLSTICRGIQDFTPLTFTFVGLTAGRAIRLLWNPITEIIKVNDWFKSYFELLDHYGRQHGVEYYKNNVLFMRFFNKNIDLYPMGPIKRTLRGDTRVVAAIDELGWFPLSNHNYEDPDNQEEEEDEAREHANADEVFASLDNSLLTVRTEVYSLYKKGISHIPTGYLLNLSSPQSQRDKIMRLLRESEDPEALSLGVQLPTWGISPLYQRNHPVIMAAYRKNAVKAERDFGANPPTTNASLFPDATLLPLFHPSRTPTHSLVSITAGSSSEEEDDDSIIHRTRGKLILNELPKDLPPSILSLDAGLTGNSFGIAVGYPDGTMLRVHTVMEIIPQKGTQIDFPNMYAAIVKPLIKDLNVKALVADRWNSITTLQSAKDDFPDLMCVQISLKARDFSALMASINDTELDLPKMEQDPLITKEVKKYKIELVNKPLSHLYLQFHTVKLVNGSLDKGDGYTDDMFRALAVTHAAAFNAKLKAHIVKFRHIGSALEGVTRAAVFSVSRGRIY